MMNLSSIVSGGGVRSLQRGELNFAAPASLTAETIVTIAAVDMNVAELRITRRADSSATNTRAYLKSATQIAFSGSSSAYLTWEVAENMGNSRVQRIAGQGPVGATNGNWPNYVDVTIAAVDISRTRLSVVGYTRSALNADGTQESSPSGPVAYFLNATTVRIAVPYRTTSSGIGDGKYTQAAGYYSIEVIESK